MHIEHLEVDFCCQQELVQFCGGFTQVGQVFFSTIVGNEVAQFLAVDAMTSVRVVVKFHLRY